MALSGIEASLSLHWCLALLSRCRSSTGCLAHTAHDHVALRCARCARLRFHILETLKLELLARFGHQLGLVPNGVVGLDLRVCHSNLHGALARRPILHPDGVALLLNAVLLLSVDVLDNACDSFVSWQGLSEGYAVVRHAHAHHPVAIRAKRHHLDVMVLPLSSISLHIFEARKKSLVMYFA